MKHRAPAVPHEQSLHEDLRDSREAALYLNASIEHGNADGILLALSDIAKANNLTQIAERIRINRVSLYKMLTKGGNPSFRNILKVLDAAGIGIQFVALRHHGKRSSRALAA
jgi:probable addiction module antidote protein